LEHRRIWRILSFLALLATTFKVIHLVVLANKIITTVWHLVLNDEVYEDKSRTTKKPINMKTVKIPVSYTLEKAIKLFTEAIQVIKQTDPE
jgi:hypothetical protein